MMNGGEKDLLNGQMWLWLNPYLEVTINPKIPTELGFYDLRFSENREAQAILAQKAGISAFCYWHYWFGNGKKLLNMPFEEVVRLKNLICHFV